MVRKPAKMYHEIKGQAYTRREYMGGVPASRIVHFDDGDIIGKYPVSLSLIASEQHQVRDNALEAARIAANKYIQKKIGNNYHLKICVYPHNVLRENKLAVGAGADRVSQGMRASFGTLVGTAARVKHDQVVMRLFVKEENIDVGKEALRRAKMKLPVPHYILVEKIAS